MFMDARWIGVVGRLTRRADVIGDGGLIHLALRARIAGCGHVKRSGKPAHEVVISSGSGASAFGSSGRRCLQPGLRMSGPGSDAWPDRAINPTLSSTSPMVGSLCASKPALAGSSAGLA